MAEKEYIEREAARNIFTPPLRDPESLDFWEWLQSEIDAIPAADVREVKRGRWINQEADSEMCSACGSRFYISALFAVGINDEPNFCPNCGADMREES